MVGSLFSSDAWNNVTFAAAEVQNPTRNLPRALAIGTGDGESALHPGNVAYLNILPFSGDPNGHDVLARGLQYAAQDRVGTAAIEVVLGAGAAPRVMAVAILLSTFGCNNGLILSGPRVYYAMARDDLFFQRAGVLHPTYRTPVFGLVAQAVWASVLCISGTYGQLLDYVIFAAIVFYFLTTLALFRLRRTRPELPRPVKAFGYPVLPALYLVANAALMVILLLEKPLFTWPGLLIVASGDAGVSPLASRRRQRDGTPDARLISPGPPPTLRDGTAPFRPADRPPGPRWAVVYRAITCVAPPCPRAHERHPSQARPHLRRRPPRAEVFGRSSARGLDQQPPHPHHLPQHSARLRRHGHRHRGRHGHRDGPGRRHRRAPQEHDRGAPGGRGGQGEAQRERDDPQPDHARARPAAARGVPAHAAVQDLGRADRGRAGPAHRDHHQPRSPVRAQPRPADPRGDDQGQPGDGARSAPAWTTPSGSWPKHRIEKLPVVDAQGVLKGLITVKDIFKRREHPNANKDQHGRLRVAAAVGGGQDATERARRLVDAGVDVLVVDSAHGHSEGVLRTVSQLREAFPDTQLIAGNIATEAGAREMVRRGVDAVKVGIGPGQHLHHARGDRRGRSPDHRHHGRAPRRGRRARSSPTAASSTRATW